MAKVKFVPNSDGFKELMKGEAMQEALLEAGKKVASVAGTDYTAGVHVADWIAISNVYPNTSKATRDNLKNNVLLKALGSVGLRMKK